MVSQMVLTNRYAPTGRAFLAAAEGFEVVGALRVAVGGAAGREPVRDPVAAPARALLDVGPHLFDLVEAAVGPVEELSGRATRCGGSR